MPEVKIILEVDDKGTVKVKQFSGETKKFFDETEKGAKKMEKPMADFSKSWTELMSKFNAAKAAFSAIKRMTYDIAVELASFGSEIERISQTMGMSIKEFQEWRYVAKMTDVEFQSLTMGLRMLSKNMLDISRGTGEAKQSFERLGISVMGSNGNLKSVNQMIPEIASKLSSITNPTEKLALTMEIFGSRSGEAFTALLRQGGPAIENLIREFSDLGLEINENTIKRLAETEGAFKRLGFTIDKLKASAVPAIEAISKATTWFAGALGKTFEYLKRISDENFALQVSNLVKQLQYANEQMAATETWSEKLFGGYEARVKFYEKRIESLKKYLADLIEERKQSTGEKVTTPTPGEGGKATRLSKEEIEKDILEYHKLLAEADKLSEAGEMPSWEDSLWSYPKQTLPDLNALNLEFNKLLVNAENLSEAGAMPDWRESLEDIPKGFIKIEDQLYSLEEIMEAYGMEAASWVKDWVANWKGPAEKMEQFYNEIGKGFGDTLISNMVTLTSATEEWGEKFKSVGTSILQTIMQIIAKQLIMNALFENSSQGTGFLSKGSGIGSILNLIGKGLLGSYQTGTDYVPRTGPYLLHEGETVTPKGGGGNNYFIDARGAQRGVSAEIMRAIRASENRAVIRSVNQVVDNKMRGGRFAKIFES